mgnify:CR=1 FL=1
MKMKLLGLLVAGIASIAIAQTPPIEHTHGRGLAENANGGRAEFGFEVNKFLRDGSTTPVVRGNFNFTAGGGDNRRPRVSINARMIERLAVEGENNNVANFGGRALLVRPNSTGQVERVEGHVQVRVADLRRPTNTDPNAPRDRMVVRFSVPGVNGGEPRVVFEFEGVVGRGDIVVRKAPTP